MSQDVQNTVWKRSRAKGTNLLVLLKIADSAQDDGRNAWSSAQHLAKAARISDRAVRLVLHKLEREGEILIERNVERRSIEWRGRSFCPPWFIEVRCFTEPQAYAVGGEGRASEGFNVGRPTRGREPEKISGFNRHQKPTAEPEKISDSGTTEIGKDFRETGSDDPQNRIKRSAHIRNSLPSSLPSGQVQGAAPPTAPERAGAAPLDSPEKDGDEKSLVPVVTKVVHTVLDLLGEFTDDGELIEAVKQRCANLEGLRDYSSELVLKSIDSARWQRKHRRGIA